MVGGVIIGITKTAGRVHVNVADCPHYPRHGIKTESVEGCPFPDTCCVYTDGKRDDGSLASLKVGDAFWWQGGYCYWTPHENRHDDSKNRCGIDYDIRLAKIGYSH